MQLVETSDCNIRHDAGGLLLVACSCQQTSRTAEFTICHLYLPLDMLYDLRFLLVQAEKTADINCSRKRKTGKIASLMPSNGAFDGANSLNFEFIWAFIYDKVISRLRRCNICHNVRLNRMQGRKNIFYKFEDVNL